MSCKLNKNDTIENDHKILTKIIYMIRHSICVQQQKFFCLSIKVDLRHHITKDLCILILSNSSMNSSSGNEIAVCCFIMCCEAPRRFALNGEMK